MCLILLQMSGKNIQHVHSCTPVKLHKKSVIFPLTSCNHGDRVMIVSRPPSLFLLF